MVVVWQYNGQNTKNDPEKNAWVFQENWADIDVKSIQPELGKYKLTLKNDKKSFSTSITPALKRNGL